MLQTGEKISMIFLLGHNGYIGSAFVNALEEAGIPWRPFPVKRIRADSLTAVLKTLRQDKPSLVINAAGFTGRPNVDECETKKNETLEANLLLPVVLASACAEIGIPWGHVSSGCIFNGAKLRVGATNEVVTDLLEQKIKQLWTLNPSPFHGFNEEDTPNFTFDDEKCSFYSGVKALAEKNLQNIGGGYIWRIRMPFDNIDHPRNYLTKLLTYPKLYDNINSLSHRGESVRACLQLAIKPAPYGVYNIVNSGFLSTRQISAMLTDVLNLTRSFQFWESDQDFYQNAARTPRSNCLLDTTKLDKLDLKMRPIGDALFEAMKNFRSLLVGTASVA